MLTQFTGPLGCPETINAITCAMFGGKLISSLPGSRPLSYFITSRLTLWSATASGIRRESMCAFALPFQQLGWPQYSIPKKGMSEADVSGSE